METKKDIRERKEIEATKEQYRQIWASMGWMDAFKMFIRISRMEAQYKNRIANREEQDRIKAQKRNRR